MISIGEIRKTFTPYYDKVLKKQSIKSRPALIVGMADSSDYVVLPVSRVSIRSNLDPDYDIEVNPAKYPLLCLNAVSYIRTHKQTVIHAAEIGGAIGNLRNSYEDLYLTVIEKRDTFNRLLTNQAL